MGSYVEEDGGKEGHPGDSRAQDCLKNRPPKRMRDERLPGSPGDQSDRRGFSAERAGFSMLGGEFSPHVVQPALWGRDLTYGS